MINRIGIRGLMTVVGLACVVLSSHSAAADRVNRAELKSQNGSRNTHKVLRAHGPKSFKPYLARTTETNSQFGNSEGVVTKVKNYTPGSENEVDGKTDIFTVEQNETKSLERGGQAYQVHSSGEQQGERVRGSFGKLTLKPGIKSAGEKHTIFSTTTTSQGLSYRGEPVLIMKEESVNVTTRKKLVVERKIQPNGRATSSSTVTKPLKTGAFAHVSHMETAQGDDELIKIERLPNDGTPNETLHELRFRPASNGNAGSWAADDGKPFLDSPHIADLVRSTKLNPRSSQALKVLVTQFDAAQAGTTAK